MTLQAINDFRFKKMAGCLERRGGRLYVVGGLARDTMIGQKLGQAPPCQHTGLGDKDLVCFGLPIRTLREAASELGSAWIIDHRVMANRKIKEPALVKLRMGEAEFSLTISRKPCMGTSFYEPGATLAEDARCRDFTVNAVYYDPLLESFMDPMDSGGDFLARRLELCSPGGLVEDPVRILRAMAFVSRLGFTPGPKLLAATKTDWPLLRFVPADRLWPEWRKWALSAWPRLGLDYLREGGALAFWPDLGALIGSPQLFKFHPEGDAWNHTLLVVEAMGAQNIPVSMGRVFLTIAALLHDIGKPKVTMISPEGRVMTKGHGPAGLPLAKRFLASIKAPCSVSKPVLRLVERHMDLSFREPTALNLKVLARRLAPFCDLGHFWSMAKADWEGRSPCPDGFPWTIEEFLEPVGGEKGPGVIPLEARQLMAGLGLSGGPTVGRLMNVVTDAFDSGKIATSQDALELAASVLADESPREAAS
ncbi:MAG: HD domain-containing protein [Deltaproteobacteria bacterium]|jgi:poly(A) polymerase|nr:HD domain-containing protein [Deltaproteobacteria bacterium]